MLAFLKYLEICIVESHIIIKSLTIFCGFDIKTEFLSFPFLKTCFLTMHDMLQEVTKECTGNFYNPLGETCESKLQKVYKVLSGFLII